MILKRTCFVLALFCMDQTAWAATCLVPLPPIVPSDPEDIRADASWLTQDFDTYFAKVEGPDPSRTGARGPAAGGTCHR
jgi:hypothetical protein